MIFPKTKKGLATGNGVKHVRQQATKGGNVGILETLKRNDDLISEEKQQFYKISRLPTILQPLVEAIDPINTQNDETPGNRT